MAPKDIVTLDAPAYMVRPLKLFVCTDFFAADRLALRAAYVYAVDAVDARTLLDRSLIKAGLLPYAKYRYQLREVPLDEGPRAEVLNSGEVG
jgi:hypothetical protein